MAVERLTAEVGARISEFKRKMAEVNAIARNAAREIRAQVDANTQPFQRAMQSVRAQMAMINGRTIWVNIRARTDRFQNEMDELASVIRTFGTVGQNMVSGGMMALFPMLVPIIAGLVGAVALAGVSIGVAAGGLLALASSFSIAALGGLALVGAMIPTISRIGEAETAIKNGDKALSDFSKPMQLALGGLTNLKDAYANLNKAVEPYILGAAGTAMSTLSNVMQILQPGIVAVADAFETMMTKLSNVVNNAPDMKANFAWFNERAAGAVTAWGEIAGYALRGFLNLMRAFDPLAQSTEQGLLGMTKRFSEWTAGLGESKKFNAFMDYVKENGPKLLTIFGNITVGIVEMFSKFGPLAADMMTGLVNLTQRFRDWATTLGENKQFQEFIQYIRDNGPGVIDLIGNIITFLVNLGIGMAPIGSKLLELTNGFLEWSNKMMEAHPWLGKMAAGLLVFAGFLKMVIPVILFFKVMFGSAFAWIWAKFAPFRTQIIAGLRMIGSGLLNFGIAIAKFAVQAMMWLGKLLAKAVVWAVRMAAQWLIAMGPIGWIIIAVVALVALIIWKWDEIKKYTIIAWTAIWNFLKTAWAFIKDIAITAGKAIANFMIELWNGIKSVAISAWEGIKAGLSAAWNGIKTVAQTVFQAIVTYIQTKWNEIKTVTSTVWNAIKTFIQTAWNNIKTAVTTAVENVKSAVKSGFESAKSTVTSIMDNIKSKIQSAWESIKSKVSTAVENIISKVKTGFQNMLTNITTVYNTIKTTISTAWENIKSTISEKLSSILSTIRSKFEEMVSAVREKLQAAYDKVVEIWGNVTSFLEGIDLFDMGANIIQGLVDGVSSMAGALVDAASGVVSGAIEGAKALLNINSPSRVFMEMGKFTGEGFAIGMKDTMRTVARASNAMIGASMPNLSPLEVATPASNAVYTPTVNVPQVEGNDSKESNTKQAMHFNFSLGRGDYKGFVSEISETQKEMDIRLKREAGN